MSSSPAPPREDATLEEELAYYKSQYEQIDLELQEFQASSKELEEQLEKDIQDSEKRERGLREKVESAGYEIEEWKTKYKQSKTEAASAQNGLQKEITSLRDTNRTLNLKLRDTEVANDDFERQARNTNSSLEDLESKYNIAIERGVLLEEEIKVGEQEREGLRIENQRVRDELSDLRIEAEILQGKLHNAEYEVEQLHQQRTASLMARPQYQNEAQRPRTSGSDVSTQETVSSPTASTPPPSKSHQGSVADTPPSPPLSDEARSAKPKDGLVPNTPSPVKRRVHAPPQNLKGALRATPRTSTTAALNTALSSSTNKTPSRHLRGPSIPMVTTTTPSARRNPALGSSSLSPHKSRPSMSNLRAPTTRINAGAGVGGADSLPRSGSLYQIRGLITKMSKLEARVQNARSKLPAPTSTPPRASPRQASGMHGTTPSIGSHVSILPGSVTIRRSGRDRRSRASNSTANTGLGHDSTPSRPISRLSFGVSATASAAAPQHEKDGAARPASALSHSGIARPPSATGHRPSSVASHHTRPESRSSLSGVRTPMSGTYSGTTAGLRRPGSRTGSRVSGNFNPGASIGHGHGHGHVREQSVSTTGSGAGQGGVEAEAEDRFDEMVTPRRGTFGRSVHGAEGSAIPGPSALPRRKSGGLGAGMPGLERRQSFGTGLGGGGGGGGEGGGGEMGPPAARRRLSEVGETY